MPSMPGAVAAAPAARAPPAAPGCRDGATGNARPTIMLRSASPSVAAPKSGASAPAMCCIRSVGVDRVRVRVLAAEVLERHAIDHAAGRRAELAFEDRVRVRAADRIHRIAADPEAAARTGAGSRSKSKHVAHQRGVVGDRIDDLDLGLLEALHAEAVDVDRPAVADAVALDRLRARVDRVGDLLRRRAAVARCCT